MESGPLARYRFVPRRRRCPTTRRSRRPAEGQGRTCPAPKTEDHNRVSAHREHVHSTLVFRRRSKDEQAATTTVDAPEPGKQVRDPQAPKGRPTPKRSEAQAGRRTRVTAPATRKEAAKQARERRRAELARQREALASGDERYLPLRDKGPLRKLARNYVDARRCVAELFLPLAVVILVLSMVPSAEVKNLSLLLWLVVIALIIADSFRIGFGIGRLARERYPEENRKGLVPYALMRSLQTRRLRLPKPQVKRGEKV